MSRGRGRGGGSENPIPAEHLSGRNPLSFYMQDNRDRVHAQVLSEDPELQRRVQDDDNESDQCEAEDELWDRGHAILRKEFESASAEVKRECEQRALDSKYESWRRFRELGRLIENEESLAQKARDDAAGIKGPIGSRGGRGRGGTNTNYLSQQGMGTFIGGVLVQTVREEITPPFNKNTMRVKVGKIESEEYF